MLTDEECTQAISCQEETVLAILERLRAYLISLPETSSSNSGAPSMPGVAMRQPSNNCNINYNKASKAGGVAEMPGRETIFAAPSNVKTSPRRDRRHSHGNSAGWLTDQQILELERQAEQQEQMQQRALHVPKSRKLKVTRQQQQQAAAKSNNQVRFGERRQRPYDAGQRQYSPPTQHQAGPAMMSTRRRGDIGGFGGNMYADDDHIERASDEYGSQEHDGMHFYMQNGVNDEGECFATDHSVPDEMINTSPRLKAMFSYEHDDVGNVGPSVGDDIEIVSRDAGAGNRRRIPLSKKQIPKTKKQMPAAKTASSSSAVTASVVRKPSAQRLPKRTGEPRNAKLGGVKMRGASDRNAHEWQQNEHQQHERQQGHQPVGYHQYGDRHDYYEDHSGYDAAPFVFGQDMGGAEHGPVTGTGTTRAGGGGDQHPPFEYSHANAYYHGAGGTHEENEYHGHYGDMRMHEDGYADYDDHRQQYPAFVPHFQQVGDGHDGMQQNNLGFGKATRVVDYQPYTQEDYDELIQNQRKGYWELGKLGPDYNPDELAAKREMADKRKAYARNLRALVQPASRSRESGAVKSSAPKVLSSRERAKQFAKNVPKPKVKEAKSERADRDNGEHYCEISELERLEMQHKQDRQRLQVVKAEMNYLCLK